MSAVLSLSSPTLQCADVVRLLQTLRLAGDVTPNRTVLDSGTEEQGCRVVLANKSDAKALWRVARTLDQVRCGHVSVCHHESGCVFDVFRETSNCPGPTNS